MEDTIEIRWYFAVIRRWLWLIVGCTMLGAVSAFLAFSWISPSYSATATLLVNVAPGASTSDYNAISASERLVLTYSQILTERSVLEAVIEQLKLGETPDKLAKRVEAMPVKDTQLIQLSVEDTDPARAALIANTMAETFIAQLKILKQARAQGNARVTLAEMARTPVNPVRSIIQYTLLAAFVSGLLALGVAFLLEYLDDTIKTPDDVSRALGLTTLGAVGRLARSQQKLAVLNRPFSPAAEAFHMLGANVRFSSKNKTLRTLLVTSPSPGEGKSLVVANLAAVMAQAGLKVIAVDADLRRPRLHQLFSLETPGAISENGLSWGFTGSLQAESSNGWLCSTQAEGLRFLPSGTPPPNPIELISSQRLRQVLQELAQQADLVLVDSSPVLAVADAAMLAQAVDGVLLVLRAGRTSREAAEHAVENLRQVGANLVGVILNHVSTHKGSYYYHHYKYYRKLDRQYR